MCSSVYTCNDLLLQYNASVFFSLSLQGIVHRDLKFENILFASTSPLSEVKLIDFGLSRVYMDTKLTEVSGTVYTMAPEVILGNHTEKADMWSIGKCIWTVCMRVYD